MTNKIDPQRQMAEAAKSDHTTMTLLLTMADTTWRMFVPSIVIIGGALMADLQFRTKPWLTLLSVPVGLSVSIMLVRRQLREIT